MSSEDARRLQGKAAWHSARLIYYERITTVSFDTMMEYLNFAAETGVVDAILLLADLYYHGSVGNDLEVDVNRAVGWYYEGFMQCESAECLLRLLRLLQKLLREEQAGMTQSRGAGVGADAVQVGSGSYLHFLTVQGTPVTVQEMFQAVHDGMTSAKWKKLVSDADYQILYSLIVQIAKLLS